MVFKALIGPVDGSFNNAADFYGYYDDIAYGVYEVTSRLFTISTFRGNDIIELRDLNVASTALIFAGTGNDTIYGNVGTTYYFDQSGNDIAFLGAGSDTAYSGTGNDLIDGGSGFDTINFDSFYDDNGNRNDNSTGVLVDLQKTTAQNFGAFGLDTIKNFESMRGSLGNDRFYGSSASNSLYGYVGNDFLDGRAGSDFLSGDNGADTLVGGTGGDFITLTETIAARDHVRYLKTNESSATNTGSNIADWIAQFDQGGGTNDDKIDLSRIDARASTTTINEAFVWRGVTASVNAPDPATIFGTSASGEVKVIQYAGDSIVFVDTDGDRNAEMIVVVRDVTGLLAVDFIL